MSTDLEPRADAAAALYDADDVASALEHVLATGDLARLLPKQRVGYYLALCKRLGLASESRPFDWLTLDGRLVLYPNKSCAEQIRRTNQISLRMTRRERVGDLFCVEVEGSRPNGQHDFASKYVPLKDERGNVLGGRLLANAYAKAETGAKRRLTFSMVGLAAVPDVEDLKGARFVTVDGHGNVIDAPTEEQRHLAERPSVARVIGEPTFESTATPEDSPVPATAVQKPTAEELEPQRREGPRPTFKASDDDVKHWLGAWFAAVKGSSLDSDDERHRYVEQWTASEGWPQGKRTDSLRTAFARMTEREAGDFLAHVRALVDDERRANEEALAAHNHGGGPEEDDEGAF